METAQFPHPRRAGSWPSRTQHRREACSGALSALQGCVWGGGRLALEGSPPALLLDLCECAAGVNACPLPRRPRGGRRLGGEGGPHCAGVLQANRKARGSCVTCPSPPAPGAAARVGCPIARGAQAPPPPRTGPAPDRPRPRTDPPPRGTPSSPRLPAASTAPRQVDARPPRAALDAPAASPRSPRSFGPEVAWRARWGPSGGSWPSTPAALSACGASTAVSLRLGGGGWGRSHAQGRLRPRPARGAVWGRAQPLLPAL